MRTSLLTIISLCLLACIEEYTDSIELREDGSAQFLASIYPCENDYSIIDNIKADYDSIKGLKFDSAWFSPRDSLYALNFKLSFENLLFFASNKKIEKDFVGHISLKKIDSIKNGYSFERIINSNIENENGAIIPEETIPDFILEQIIKNDSSHWEYTLILPKGAMLINSEPIDTAYINQKELGIIRWKIPAGEAISKRVFLKADFLLPSPKPIDWQFLIGIAAGCIVMLLAIVLLVRKLKKLSVTLKELKNTEKNLTGE